MSDQPFTVPTLDGPISATTVPVPGSKSIANRALVCAGLADGASIIEGIPDGDDVAAMLDGLGALGVAAAVDGDSAAVDGVQVLRPERGAEVHARLAGTTSRFLAAMAALSPTPVLLDGYPALRGRPFDVLFEALGAIGAEIEPTDATAPLDQLPALIAGPLHGGQVEMSGDVSSQFISALMLVAPRTHNGVRIDLSSPLVSRPYVEMTAAVMAEFGHDDVTVGADTITVGPGAYAARTFRVEPDASSASYPLALAAINGGSVTIEGLGFRSLQGDVRFADLLSSMGCTVDVSELSITVTRPVESALTGIEVDMADISDLVPTVAAVAAFADTATVIDGVGFIRRKESDRLGDLSRELRRLGVDIDELPDGLVIRPSSTALRGGAVDTHHDHRLAMAFGLIGSRVSGVAVDDPAVVSKSWPGYWSMVERLTSERSA